jgi:formylglycine-generating enzyme required for sulfatase activity
LYSCKPGQKSYYYDPTNSKTKGRERSLFMHHLIESWGKVGKVTVEEVFKSVRENASADADVLFGRVQTPVIRREYKGEGEWVVALSEFKPGEEREFEIAQGVKMKFCWIPGGEAQLGSTKDERDEVLKQLIEAKAVTDGKVPDWLESEGENNRHKFKTRGFWLGKYPVTQEEWQVVMGDNPSYFRLDGIGMGSLEYHRIKNTSRFPVEMVSWDDCQRFLQKLNKGSSIKKFDKPGFFVLPHEDQWEYACRAGKGNKQPFFWGNDLNGTQANCAKGRYPSGEDSQGKSLGLTCSVDFTNGGNYKVHPWGLCHITGNVWQWCDNNYEKIKEYRMLRGGSFVSEPRNCRSADRLWLPPNSSEKYAGFRVCFRQD